MNSIFYNEPAYSKTDIMVDPDTRDVADPIEVMIARVTALNEPIEDSAPYIGTEEKEGVIPETDIRTDKWDEALEMATAVAKSELQRNSNEFLESQKNLANGTDITKSGEESTE